VNASAIPNLITFSRILLVGPVVWLLAAREFTAVLLLFGVAAASDALDGYLARRFDWGSRLGALLDPIADKLLLVSSVVTLGWLGLLPWWLVLLVVARDLIIVGGAFAYQLLVGEVEMAPTLLSKANTALQVAVVLLLLFAHGLQPLPRAVLDGVMYGLAVTTLASGGHYVWSWANKALRAKGRTPP
jgi:cardiolipin synthase